MSTDQQANPSETSPLLARSQNENISSIDDSASAAAQAVNPSGHKVDAEAANAPLERHASFEGRLQQYEGIPELRKRMKYMFPPLTIGVFLSAADQTIIVSSYGRIGSDLNALNKTSWVATAYFLTLASFQPLYGKMSDIFGRKPCLLFAYTIFGLGCLFCGLAQNINQLIVARAIAGIGGAGLTTVVSILLSDIISLKDRGAWQGYINIVFAIGAGTGAPMGGFFADGPGWRWSFLFQVPLCVVAFISVGVTLKLPRRAGDEDWKTKLRRIDFAGSLTLVCAVSALLFGLDRGSNVSWSEKACWIPLALSGPLFVLVMLVELRFASEPFAPGRIIFNRSLFPAYLCNALAYASAMAAQFFVPLYLQAFHGFDAFKAGLLMCPWVLAGVTGSLSSGFYMRKSGKYYWVTCLAYFFLTSGLVVIICSSGLVIHSTAGLVLGTVILALGNGMGVTTSLIALISNAHRDDQAIATACSYLFRSLGTTIGVSLSSTAANQTLRATLRSHLGNGPQVDKIMERARRSLPYIKTLEPHVRDIVRQCYAASTRAAFSFDAAVAFGALLAAFFILEKPLSARASR